MTLLTEIVALRASNVLIILSFTKTKGLGDYVALKKTILLTDLRDSAVLITAECYCAAIFISFRQKINTKYVKFSCPGETMLRKERARLS